MKKHAIILLSWICLLLSSGSAPAQYHDPQAAGTALSEAERFGAGAETEIKFYERQSNFGDCNWLPPGAICLTFSDQYKWIVKDYRINFPPTVVASSNCLPVELIRCYYADYYHILGTSLVAIGEERDSVMKIETPPFICPTQPSSIS